MKNLLKNLYKMLCVVKKYLISYVISTFGVASRNLFINVLNVVLFSTIIKAAQVHNGDLLIDGMYHFLVLLVIFVIADSFFGLLQKVTINNMANFIRHKILKNILFSSMKDIDNAGGGSELISRINMDVDLAMGIYDYGIVVPLLYLISGVGGIIVVVNINYVILLWAIFIGTVSLCFNIYLGNIVKRLYSKIQQNKSKLLLNFTEVFNNGMLVKLLHLYRPMSCNLKKNLCEYRQLHNENAVISAFINLITVVEGILQYVGTILLGIYLYSRNLITLDNIIVAAQMVGMITMMFTCIGDSFVNLQRSIIGVERIFELLNLPSEDYNEYSHSEYFEGYAGENAISIKGLSFAYDEKNNIINDFSAEIMRNKLTILHGHSGRGKSTLLKILCKFYDYHVGEIKVFNKELKEYNLKELRNIISYVQQGDGMFKGTIKENLTMGKNNISMDDIEQSTKAVYIHDFIRSLPEGYDTYMWEQNISLSGGERQCIAIARALIEKKPILLMDESLSAMNNELAQNIVKNILQCTHDTTIVLVTHDENLIKDELYNALKVEIS